MPNQPNHTTHVRETRKSGSGTIAFIVGGLVVAVGIIAWIIFGGSADITSGAGGTDSTTTNVTIQPAPEAAPEPAVPAPEPTAPAPEPAAPAPAGN